MGRGSGGGGRGKAGGGGGGKSAKAGGGGGGTATPAAPRAEGRGTAERAALAEGLRTARATADVERRGEIVRNVRAYAAKQYNARVAAMPAVPAHLDAVRRAVAAADAADRGINVVTLRAVRARLPGLSRTQQDAAIRHLRVQDRVALHTHDGLLRRLSRSELRAAVREAGSTLTHISRT